MGGCMEPAAADRPGQVRIEWPEFNQAGQGSADNAAAGDTAPPHEARRPMGPVASRMMRAPTPEPVAPEDMSLPQLIVAVDEAGVRRALAADPAAATARCDDGMTPLHWASDCGNLAAVMLLLEAPTVDINAQDDEVRSPPAGPSAVWLTVRPAQGGDGAAHCRAVRPSRRGAGSARRRGGRGLGRFKWQHGSRTRRRRANAAGLWVTQVTRVLPSRGLN